MEKKSEVVVKDHEEEEKEEALPGFRFHPTDEELVGFYLRRRVEKKPISIEIIKEMDIYKYDPWDLPKACTIGGQEKEWYFFCLRGRKYRNSIRPNRVTGSGFWKATGIDRPIHSDSDDCIGLKKSLVYYRGSAGKGTKTDWMMHEFRLPSKNAATAAGTSPSTQEAEIWTICRIFKRNVSFMKKYAQDWKQAIINKQAAPADSGSKSSSFESDARVDAQLNAQYPTSYGYEGIRTNYQVLGGKYWNHAVQAPVPALHAINVVEPSANSTNTNEMTKDGNWDELGRIMEYMLPASAENI